MNARIRLFDRMSNKQKADIEAYAKKVARSESEANLRRILKIVCIALHEKFGFGRDRLMTVINEVGIISETRKDDEVFWYHVDREMKALKLDFDPEDYERMDK